MIKLTPLYRTETLSASAQFQHVTYKADFSGGSRTITAEVRRIGPKNWEERVTNGAWVPAMCSARLETCFKKQWPAA